MAIRTSGPLPITEIVTEFGGTVPHGLSEYYGNGVFLSKGYFPPTPAIPISPNPLKISNFYGKTRKVPVTIEITANTSNVNAFSLFKSALTPYSSVDVSATLIVKSGVTVSGSLFIGRDDSTRTTGFRPVDDFTLINNGNIVGNPGGGGAGGAGPSGIGSNGGLGSTPLQVNRIITLTNTGTIAGGATGGKGGNGGTMPGTTNVNCQQNCTVYNYSQKHRFTCQYSGNSEERCDDARTMGVMNRYNGQCDCGTCDGGRGCRPSQQMGQDRQKMSCRTFSNQCQQAAISVPTAGGNGGMGAPPTNANGATAGTAGGGGTATAGATGGTWGGMPWVIGYANISNRPNIGGTLLGGTS
jgi:hypothetical protein